MTDSMQIGEVADRTGLSLRTIRYYGEVGLVVPHRTEGGFRLYDEDDIATLELIKQMKPLDFSLEEMREVIDMLAELAGAPVARRQALAEQLRAVRELAAERHRKLTARLRAAEGFVAMLDATLDGRAQRRV